MPIFKTTKAEEAVLLKLFAGASPDQQEVMKAEYPMLFGNSAIIPPPVISSAPPPPWSAKVGLYKVVKRRAGLSLIVTLFVNGGSVTFTTSELMNPKIVQERLIAVCECVPVMPSIRAWPAEVEMLIQTAEVASEEDTITEEQFMKDELASFLGSNIEAVVNPTERRAAFMAMISNQVIHGVFEAGNDPTLYTHAKSFTTYLAKQNGGLRKDWEDRARQTLKLYFSEFRTGTTRGLWQAPMSEIRDVHGFDVPIDDDIGRKQ